MGSSVVWAAVQDRSTGADRLPLRPDCTIAERRALVSGWDQTRQAAHDAPIVASSDGRAPNTAGALLGWPSHLPPALQFSGVSSLSYHMGWGHITNTASDGPPPRVHQM